MGKVTLRVRHEGGQGVVRGLDPGDSVEKLVTHSVEALGLQEVDTDTLRMLSGFPPVPLDLTDRDRSVESLGIRTGDTIIIQNLKPTASPAPPPAAPSPSLPPPSPPPGPSEAKRPKPASAPAPTPTAGMERKVVPADNSCLFTAINYCMSGEVVASVNSTFMREVIASQVGSDEEKYSEAILGRGNRDYCAWILTKDAWGGAIEVQILAEYFQVEILVVDTVSGSQTVFGEGRSFPSRLTLIYDGIHYDALFLREPSGQVKTVLPSNDKRVEGLAREVAATARAARQYTDTKGFQLKCLVCGVLIKGDAEATKHAKDTKHTNFSEV